MHFVVPIETIGEQAPQSPPALVVVGKVWVHHPAEDMLQAIVVWRHEKVVAQQL